MLAQGIAVGVKKLSAGYLVADILGLEKIEHAQAIDWIFSRGAVINVSSQRKLDRIEAPGDEAFIAHAAVAGFIISPARSVVYPLPGQDVGKRSQHQAASFNCPNFIQVTDRGAQLQLHPLSVGKVGIDHVRPIEAAWPEARITSGPVGNGICLRAGQRPGWASAGDEPTPTPPTCERRLATVFAHSCALARDSGLWEISDWAQRSNVAICSSFSMRARERNRCVGPSAIESDAVR